MQVVNYKLPFCAFFVLTLIAGNQLYGQAPIIQPGPPGQLVVLYQHRKPLI